MASNEHFIKLLEHTSRMLTTRNTDRHVFIGQPGYGDVTSGAARAFWRASDLPDENIYRQYHHGSLLTANFNSLWASALNLAHSGRRLDYFSMIHADIEAPEGWLDSLIDEMESHDLDMLGVVVPIKDPKGLTSIALGRPDGDTWRPLCRLTMSDVFRLPATFTSDDIGHPLLLNTGLWVIRFDPEVCKKLHFTINDRIVFDRGSNRYLAECEPEDWYFSRLCHELGLRIGCTRKIKVNHRGPANFGNDRPWGLENHDRAWIDASPVDTVPPGKFSLPGGIPGWLTYEEGKKLAELAEGKRVLEVGSYCGLSTVCMARMATNVTSIDPHDGRGTANPMDTMSVFTQNILRHGVGDKVAGHRMTFAEYAARTSDFGSPIKFDLIFIDGAHDREAVESDIANALPLLVPNGLLAFHDYGEANGNLDPGVTGAVDALITRGGALLSVTDSLAVVRPPALTPSLLEV